MKTTPSLISTHDIPFVSWSTMISLNLLGFVRKEKKLLTLPAISGSVKLTKSLHPTLHTLTKFWYEFQDKGVFSNQSIFVKQLRFYGEIFFIFVSEANAKYVLGCQHSVVRMVSSGEFQNTVTFQYAPPKEEQLQASDMC